MSLPEKMIRRTATGVVSNTVVIAILCGLSWSCAPSEEVPSNVILISIDTLRADHLGSYGYARATSPFLDSLAEDGVRFENSFVQLPGTLPSHMSMLTGLYPEEHGVMPPTGVLSPSIPMIQEILQQQGFRTAGFTEGGYADGGYGFARGFDRFSDESNKMYNSVVDTLDRGLAFLESIEKEDRYFLFLHTYAVHDPYFPPPPYKTMFWDRPAPTQVEPTGPNLVKFNRVGAPVPADVTNYYKALYDASIRYLDDQLRDFFASAEDIGVLDDTVVIITSDHGEEFQEHGRFVHEQLYREHLHVPLIVLGVGASRSVPEIVQSIDLAPTILDLLGLGQQEIEMSGRSLRPLLEGSGDWEPRPAYSINFSGVERGVIDATDGLHHLLRVDDQPAAQGEWIAHEFSFDTAEEHIDLSAIAFHRPRELTVSVDNEVVVMFEVGVDWTPLPRIENPRPGGPVRVRVAADSCDAPSDVSGSRDQRCLAFRIRGATGQRIELYEIDEDLQEQRDLSRQNPEAVRRLVQRLRDHEPRPVAHAEEGKMSPELEERLRSLGYLQ